MSRNSLINISLVIIGTIIGLLLCEFGLRLYYFGSLKEPLPEVHLRQPHKTLGWCLRPNKTAFQQTLDYTVKVSINSKGLRDVEHDYKKEEGVFRIVVLGDSFMEAYQVPLEKSFPRLLEKNLNEISPKKVEVINLGVGGYGTAQEYLYLKQEGVKYNPDLVILAFLGCNDVRNNSRLLELKLWRRENTYKVAGRPFYSIDDDGELILHEPDFENNMKLAKRKAERFKKKTNKRALKDRLLFYRLLKTKINSINANVYHRSYNLNAMLGAYFPVYDKNWVEAWVVTKRIISMTNKLSLKHGARFLLFSVPAKLQVEKDYFENALSVYQKRDPYLKIDLEKPENILKSFCEENEIYFLSMLEEFREFYLEDKKLYHVFVDQHWNKEGHKLASSLITNYIIEEKII